MGKGPAVIEEIPAEDFGYAEDEMAVGYGPEDFLANSAYSGTDPTTRFW